MNNRPQIAPPKPEPINFFLKLMLLIVVMVPIAICWIFFFGKLYGTIALAVYLVLMLVMMWLRRRRRITEAEMLRQIDKAMGEPTNDPRQMARFVR